MLSMFVFVKITMHVLRASCKLWLSIYFNLFTPACVNLVEYTFEPSEQENYQFNHFHLVKRHKLLR